MRTGLALPWLFLSACGPSPEELRVRLANGDLAVVGDIEKMSSESPLASLVPLANRWQALQPDVAALAAAEGPLLVDSVEQSIAAGDWLQAAARLGTLRQADAADPATLVSLSDRIERHARAASPAVTYPVLSTLAEVWSGDAARSRRLRQDTVLEAVEARYSLENIEAVRAGQRGITLAAAEALLRRVDRAYVVPVNWTLALQHAATRLGALAATPSAHAPWPRLAQTTFTGGVAADVDAAIAALQRAIALGEQAEVPSEVIVDEWVAGALGSLDPWTRAVWPAELASWSEGHAGVYAGVGLELVEGAPGEVRVDLPLPSTPAWRVDIRQDDLLIGLADDTGSVQLADVSPEHRLSVARAGLRGPVDSAVRLELQREGVGTVVVELRRATVAEETVEGWQRTQDANQWQVLVSPPSETHGIAYVRIVRFKPTTEAAFDALLEPHLDDIYGVVLDLRGNPGGDVNSAVQIADRFVADGWLAQLDGRVLPDTGPDIDPTTKAELAEWNRAIPGHALEGVAVAVLVDDATASAAEVLAGALQERANAVVLGAATWGKGRAQALRTAEDGSYGVQFTNVVWTLPSGRRLDRNLDGGITPAIELPMGPAAGYQTAQQRLIRTALKVHRDGTPLRQPVLSLRPGLPPLADDPALVAAELVLRAQLLEPEH